MMTRREALIGGGASLLSSAAGFVFGNGRDVVQTFDDVDDVIGAAQNLRYLTFQTHSGWDVSPVEVFVAPEIGVSSTFTTDPDDLTDVDSYDDTHYVAVMFHGRKQRETDADPPRPDNWEARTDGQWISPVAEYQDQPIASFGSTERVARQFDLSKRFTGLCFELDASSTLATFRYREAAPGGEFETTFGIDFSELV